MEMFDHPPPPPPRLASPRGGSIGRTGPEQGREISHCLSSVSHPTAVCRGWNSGLNTQTLHQQRHHFQAQATNLSLCYLPEIMPDLLQGLPRRCAVRIVYLKHFLVPVSLNIQRGLIGSRTPLDNTSHRCPSPLYKIAQSCGQHFHSFCYL